MAISGATKADALASARKLGIGIPSMLTTLNVSSTTPTCTASETAPNAVTVAWTNLDGPKMVDVGDGLPLRGPVDSSAANLVVTGVVNGTYTAKVYGLGRSKASGSYVVDGT